MYVGTLYTYSLVLLKQNVRLLKCPRGWRDTAKFIYHIPRLIILYNVHFIHILVKTEKEATIT